MGHTFIVLQQMLRVRFQLRCGVDTSETADLQLIWLPSVSQQGLSQ